MYSLNLTRPCGAPINLSRNSTDFLAPFDFQIHGELSISLLHSSISASAAVKPTLCPENVESFLVI